MREREEGAHGGGCGGARARRAGPGRTGPGWAGLGWAEPLRGSKTHDVHDH
jgi:hypothetical protein